MDVQYSRRWLHGFGNQRFPGLISSHQVVAEPRGADNVLEFEGELLQAIELGYTDTDGSSALHIPSSGLVVAGDAVHGDVHLYLAESQGSGRHRWLDALDTLERLGPTAVVSGHKRHDAPDSPDDIDRTRRYILQFEASARTARGHLHLYKAMISLYPDRLTAAYCGTLAKPSWPDQRAYAHRHRHRPACPRPRR